MKEKPENKLIRYSLARIQNNSFEFNQPAILSDSKTDINYNISPQIKYNIENEFIIVEIVVIAKVKETDEKVLESKNSFVYHAVDLKSHLFFSNETDSWTFINPKDEGLIVTLIGLSVSTVRGIIYEKTKGTVLEIKTIPIVNPNIFVKKN